MFILTPKGPYLTLISTRLSERLAGHFSTPLVARPLVPDGREAGRDVRMLTCLHAVPVAECVPCKAEERREASRAIRRFF